MINLTTQNFQSLGTNKYFTISYETNVIGSGAQGTVYRVAQINGKPYGTWVIKVLIDPPAKVRKNMQERLKALVDFMNSFNAAAESLSCIPFELLQSQTDKKLAILMRFAPDHDLENGGKLPSLNALPQRLSIAYQISKNVRRLHEKGIIIGDIANDNVIIDHLNWALYLIDLDGIGFTHNGKVYELLTDNSGKGSFCPPEFDSKKPYTIEMDLWGLSTLLHFILTDYYPMANDLFGLARIYSNTTNLVWPPSNHPKSAEHLEKLGVYGNSVRDAFLTTFNQGRVIPTMRLTALAWETLFTESQKYMYQCNCNKDKPFVAITASGQPMIQCPKCNAALSPRKVL